MNQEQISVIVPAYNCAQWLPRCIDSLLAQTYENLEIIVVNDGSQDNTKEVLEIYVSRFPNVRAIHKANGGEYAARVTGVEQAAGAWIGFVDADDEVEPEMYAHLMENAVQYSADISHCGFKVIYPDGKTEYLHNSGIVKLQDRPTGLRDLLEDKLVENGLTNKMFRRELFAGLKEKMDFSLVVNGDFLMNFYLFEKAERSIYEDFCSYHYLIREGSISRRKLNNRIIYDPIRVRQIILEQCTEDMKDDARRALARMCLVSYRLLAMENRKEYEADIHKVRELIREQLPYAHLLPKRNAMLVRLISGAPWIFDSLYPTVERLFRR